MENQNQRRSENQNQPQNIGKWEAWTANEGNTMHLHVKGSLPTDAKNQNFTLKPAASQGSGKSLILELDHHEGINAKGKETASIREFDLPLGSQKYDSVIIRSKGINNVATVPVQLRNKKP